MAGLAAALAVAGTALGESRAPAGYRQEVEQWRQQRETGLRAEDGWLSLAGLWWLKQGDNRVGSGAGFEVRLPGSAPGNAGVLTLQGEAVKLALAPGVNAAVNGKAVRGTVDLRSDKGGQKADVVGFGDVSFLVIFRGTRFAVRVKDKNSDLRRNFKGNRWFPIDEQWRVTARFIPYEKSRRTKLDTVVNEQEEYENPGYLTFRQGGREFKLDAMIEEGKLFLIFRDRTAGKTTYGAARFLKAEMPKNGETVLDFNKAYNPPCAFTSFSTCPLPPPMNRLTVEIPVGEQIYR